MPVEPHSNQTVASLSGEVQRLATVVGDAAAALTVSTSGVTPIATETVFACGEFTPGAAADGTDTTPVSGTVYVNSVYIPDNCTLTGVAVMNGSVVTNNAIIVSLYTKAGVLVANSALAGTTTAGVDTIQRVPFTATYAAKGPQKYFVGVSYNGTTDRLNTMPVGFHPTTSQAGVFGTLAAISSPPTTFTTAVGPISATY